MNKIVAEVVSRLPIRPMEYIWFDMTEDGINNQYSDWIDKNPQIQMTDTVEEIPFPFEKIGIIVALNMTGVTNNHFNDTVPFPMTMERNGNTLSIKTYYHGFPSHVNEMIYEGTISGFKVKIDPEYRKKFSMIPDFFDNKAYTNFTEIFWNNVALLAYAIPNQGVVVNGYRPSDMVGNEKRRKNGKKQLFKWTTIELKHRPPAERIDLGGTHASPTPHERRGHQRRLKSGKVVYIKSMVINRHKIPTDGYIHHDYKVSA